MYNKLTETPDSKILKATGTNSNPKPSEKRTSARTKKLDGPYDWKSMREKRQRGELAALLLLRGNPND